MNLKRTWVKAHQDDYKTPYRELSDAAKRNIRVDHIANDYLLDTRRHQTLGKAEHVDAQAISICIQGTRITGRYEDAIRQYIDGSYLRHYLSDKHKLTDSTWACIGWYGNERHLESSKGLIFSSEFIHDWQPTNSRHRLKFAQSTDASIGLCPCCKTTLEDHDHILRRPAQKRTHYLALNDIRGTIAEIRSPAGPLLRQGLNHWLSKTSEPLFIDASRYSGHTQLLVQ